MSHRFEQKKIQSRINRIRGQVDGVERLLTQNEDCIKLLQQIAAVRGAVDGLMSEVLEHHIREHLVDQGSLTTERAADVDQLVVTLRSYLKK